MFDREKGLQLLDELGAELERSRVRGDVFIVDRHSLLDGHRPADAAIGHMLSRLLGLDP